MLKMSDATLKINAKNFGYRPEMLEKVYRLMDLLEKLMSIDYLTQKLALKGGTALNLFYSDSLPRLSVDLDFNYVGSSNREVMLTEKIDIEKTLIDVCQRCNLELDRNAQAFAGGKMIWSFDKSSKNKGYLEIDLNYMYRVPLFDLVTAASIPWPKSISATVVDIHELAAGKLLALLSRNVSRDLFDSHRLLTVNTLEIDKLRLAFISYVAMSREAWRDINPDRISFSTKEIRNKLLPVLHRDSLTIKKDRDINGWAEKLVKECNEAMSILFPFRDNETEFLDRLQKFGEIRPEIISKDYQFCERLNSHPLIIRRAQIASGAVK